VRSRRAVSPNPRQGGTAPITAQLLACRAARPGPARPTAARRDRRAVPTGRVARPETACRPSPPQDGAAPNRPPRSCRWCASVPPCRSTPSSGKAPDRPRSWWCGPETAVPPYPRGAARRLTGLAHCGWWLRDRRVAPFPGGAARHPTRLCRHRVAAWPRNRRAALPSGAVRHPNWPRRCGWGCQTAVSPCPRGTAPTRRAASEASGLDGRAPRVGRGCRAARRWCTSRPPCRLPVGRRGT